jgi:hypothetical protein
MGYRATETRDADKLLRTAGDDLYADSMRCIIDTVQATTRPGSTLLRFRRQLGCERASKTGRGVAHQIVNAIPSLAALLRIPHKGKPRQVIKAYPRVIAVYPLHQADVQILVEVQVAAEEAMNSTNPLEQQREYLRQHAAQIASFAKTQHGHQGRGIVVIGWPAPHFLKLEDILDSTSYLPEDALALAGFDTADEMFRVVREYDPAQQAIIMCIETMRMSFNVHVLTPIYRYTAPHRPTSH